MLCSSMALANADSSSTENHTAHCDPGGKEYLVGFCYGTDVGQHNKAVDALRASIFPVLLLDIDPTQSTI